MSWPAIFYRNNLAESFSPYLRRHRDNPVGWQEWNEKTAAHARKTAKTIFR